MGLTTHPDNTKEELPTSECTLNGSPAKIVHHDFNGSLLVVVDMDNGMKQTRVCDKTQVFVYTLESN